MQTEMSAVVMAVDDMDVDVYCGHKPSFSILSFSTQTGSEALEEVDDSEFDSFEGNNPSQGTAADDCQGIDEDEYYAFLREMGCSFEQELSDDEESCCSDDDLENDLEDDLAPESVAAIDARGVVPATRMDDLPTLEGLDIACEAQGPPVFPVPSGCVDMRGIQVASLPSPTQGSYLGGRSTSIAPGPSTWLLQALQAEAETVPLKAP